MQYSIAFLATIAIAIAIVLSAIANALVQSKILAQTNNFCTYKKKKRLLQNSVNRIPSLFVTSKVHSTKETEEELVENEVR